MAEQRTTNKRNPKEKFLERLIELASEFEHVTGCELKRIDFHRILTFNNKHPLESVFGDIELTLK